MAKRNIIKAPELVELLNEYDIKLSRENVSRFAKQYGIKNDPNRPSHGPFYLKPSDKELKEIKKKSDANRLKASGSTEEGIEASVKRKARVEKLLKQGYNQTEVVKLLEKEFGLNPKSTVSKVSSDLKKQGFKISDGRIVENKTPQQELFAKYAKRRRKDIDEVSSGYVERLIRDAKREAGYGELDLSHRLSIKQNKILGTKLISSNLGLDPQEVNRVIIKPVEDNLNDIFKDQMKVVKKIKREGTSLELRKKLEGFNKEITDIVEGTDRRLQGMLIDEVTLKPIQYGVNYATSFGAGVIPDKPISELNKQEISLAIKQLPGQVKAVQKFKPITKINPRLLGASVVGAVAAPMILSPSKTEAKPPGMDDPMSPNFVDINEARFDDFTYEPAKQPLVKNVTYDKDRNILVTGPETRASPEDVLMMLAATENKQEQEESTLGDVVKDTAMLIGGATAAFAAPDALTTIKESRGAGRGALRTAGDVALKGFYRLGSPLATAGFTLPQVLDEDTTATDIVTDPFNYLGLATMETFSKKAGAIAAPAAARASGIGSLLKNYKSFENIGEATPGKLNALFRLGLSPRVIAGASRFLGLPGLIASSAYSLYDYLSNRESE